MDISPLARAGRQIVESYGGGRFRVSGRAYEGSVLVLPERTLPWPVTAIEALSLDSLAPVTAAAAWWSSPWKPAPPAAPTTC